MDAKTLELLNSFGSDLNALEEPRYLRLLIYGDPKIGKTDLVTKILGAIGGKSALISTDSGWVTALKYPEIAENIKRYQFDSFGQIRLMAQAHEEGVEPFSEMSTFVWDTASTGIDLSLRDLVNQKKFNDQIDPEAEGWTHYRLVSRKLRETVKAIRKSNLHFIMTAHVREPTEQDRAKSKFNIRPNMPEKSYNILAEEANLIGWLHKEGNGKQRLIQFEGTNRVSAGSQISTIENKIYPVEEVPELIAKWIQG